VAPAGTIQPLAGPALQTAWPLSAAPAATASAATTGAIPAKHMIIAAQHCYCCIYLQVFATTSPQLLLPAAAALPGHPST
jgi:hypothetical protein